MTIGDRSRFQMRSSHLADLAILKHLAGQHDQRTHGAGGMVIGAPTKDEQRAKEKAVWELHETGKTWEQVAKELGYANGGAARKAGMRHKERLDKEGETATSKPDTPTPATPKPRSGSPKEQIEQLRQEALGDRDLRAALIDATGVPAGSVPSAKEIEIVQKLTEAGGIARAEIDRRLDEMLSPETKALKAEVESLKKLDVEYEAVVTERDRIKADIQKAEFEATRSVARELAVERGIDPKVMDSIVKRNDKKRDEMGREGHVAAVADAADKKYPLPPKTSPDYPEAKAQWDAYATSLSNTLNTAIFSGSNKWQDSPQNAQLKKALEDSVNKMIDVNKRRDPLLKKRRLLDERVEMEIGSERRRVTQEVVTEMTGRGFGTTTIMIGDHPFVQAPLKLSMERDFPRAWADPDTPGYARIDKIDVEQGDRGGWSPFYRTITMSEGDASKPRTMAQAMHELTHVAQTNRLGMKQAEFVYWHLRAKGEKVRSFKAIQGSGRANEFTVEDKWANLYSGRVYADNKKPERDDFFEIMSTGMEGIYYGKKTAGGKAIDSEHADFVLAMMMFA